MVMANPSDRFLDRNYWLERAPSLHIGDAGIAASPIRGARAAGLKPRLLAEGYFQAHHEWGIDLAPLAQTVRALASAKMLPVFCFVYDEVWALFRALEPLYRAFLGDYAILPAFWAWNIDPGKGEAGWSMHRDRGRHALMPDGAPVSLTTWIALSRATPENGCLYIVPANADPTYNTPLEDVFVNFKSEAAEARARPLPAGPGDFFMWNQAVLHWGGRSSPQAQESRVSLSLEFQRTDVRAFEKPLIGYDAFLPLEERLKLIATQILKYRHMYAVDSESEAFARTLLGRND